MTRTIHARPFSALVVLVAMTVPQRLLAAPPAPPDPATAAAEPATTPPPPPPPVTPPPAPTPHLAPYVAGAIAVAAAGVGTAFGVLALNAKSNFERYPTQSEADTGNNYAAYSDAAFGAAVIAGVTSLVFFLAERNAPSSAVATQPTVPQEGVKLTASPLVSPHGAGVGAVLHF